VVLFQLFMVGSGTVIVTFGPGMGHNLHQVFVPLIIFGQQNQVPAPGVFLNLLTLLQTAIPGHIDLTTDDGFEPFFFGFSFVLFRYVIEKLLDAKHVSVIRQSQGFHTIAQGFINQGLYRSLTVQDGELGMHV